MRQRSTGWRPPATPPSDDDRDLAFANLLKAAKHYGIVVEERRWQDLGRHPDTHNSSEG